MLPLLLQGHVGLFTIILFCIVFSLTLHEYGHAFAAKKLGDNTAESMGRLTLNPVAHIDPWGLIMVIFIGFGWARPVPFDGRNINHRWGAAIVAAAGPAMNLIIAIVAANLLALSFASSEGMLAGQAPKILFQYLATINLLLMLFNLIPLGPLDGHYILPRFLSVNNAIRYERFNAQYGAMLLMGLIVLSLAGVPIFRYLFEFSNAIIPYLIVL